MRLTASCPRCPESFGPLGPGTTGECTHHGDQPPLLRAGAASYDLFTEHLRAADGFPTYLPWPMGSGWRVTDFGVVVDGGRATATVTCCSGATPLDGRVDVLVVAEEAGVGLGARCAGLPTTDPGAGFGQGPPSVRVRIDSQGVPLWPVSTAGVGGELDRSVVAGEAGGRWLWLVLLPASAVLLLGDEWLLRDVSREGPHLVDLPFEGPPPVW